MNPQLHKKCRDAEGCSGPGCVLKTGKTERKQNHARPHPNKRNADPSSTKKGGK